MVKRYTIFRFLYLYAQAEKLYDSYIRLIVSLQILRLHLSAQFDNQIQHKFMMYPLSEKYTDLKYVAGVLRYTFY